MKKNLITSTVFLAVGMAFGVFYREFTKFNGFTGRTALAFAHPHLLVLGCLLFLFLALVLKNDEIVRSKKFKWFYYLQIVGLSGTAIMMAVRGIFQVLGTSLSSGVDSMISGIAGVFHVTLAAGLIMLFVSLFDMVKNKEAKEKA
ncbi:MAG: DUF2871 domain-containing protein [Bacilli bacterium]|jgi:hypothetical protein|nr:DUF2871 domain-containing protein [Bacilli bacterium]MCI2054625.1 DUF2871 domain-containing protein [Bacilli bacterium]